MVYKDTKESPPKSTQIADSIALVSRGGGGRGGHEGGRSGMRGCRMGGGQDGSYEGDGPHVCYHYGESSSKLQICQCSNLGSYFTCTI